MPYDYSEIMKAQFERLAIDQAAASAELEASRLSEDSEGTMRAAQRILELDAQRNALAQRANQYQAATAQAQSQPQNKYGLTADEAEIARNSFGAIKRNGRLVDLSDDEKLRTYAENKAEYRRKLSTGEYSNQFQSSVRR